VASFFFQTHPVTSSDFKFYLDALLNPHVQLGGAAALRSYYSDIDSLTLESERVFVVRWKSQSADGKMESKYSAFQLVANLRPLPCFVFQHFPDGTPIVEGCVEDDVYRHHSVWAQNFCDHWAKNILVSCGPWKPSHLTDKQITLQRNSDYFDPFSALSPRLEFTFHESPDALWQNFKAGNLDTCELPPDQVGELQLFMQSPVYKRQLEKGESIHQLQYLAQAFSYVGWNLKNPLFSSRKVRQALAMAVDPNQMIARHLQGLAQPITGSFFYNSPSYNKGVLPYFFDVERAKALLEEEGWYDSDGDGIRDKIVDGQRLAFRFKLTYYVKNPVTRLNGQYLAMALKEVGIDCQLHGVDMAELSQCFDNKNFDALAMGWALGLPPEDPRQLWHSEGALQKGSSNFVSFENKEADALIEKLTFERDEGRRQQLYHRLHALIYEESPYLFLYSPKTILLYRDRVQNAFLPTQRKDLMPQACAGEPLSELFWVKKR
jgi:peptide/nickel transport system substrate-binding protein